MDTMWLRALEQGQQQGFRYRWRSLKRSPVGQSDRYLASLARSSREFREFRDYRPGDDLRYLDWYASARTDRLLVRVFEQELHPHVELIVDGSPSMDLPDSEKARASLGLVALLATAAKASGFSYRTFWLGDSCQLVATKSQLPVEWRFDGFVSRVSGGAVLLREMPRWRPRSVRVLVSDLFLARRPAGDLGPTELAIGFGRADPGGCPSRP